MELATQILETPNGVKRLHYRPSSKGDVGVIGQIFQQQDYNVSAWPQGQSLLRHHFQRSKERPSLIIDAGANIGASSLYWHCMLSDIVVYSIEPQADNFRLLEKNTEECANAINFHGAIASVDGKVSIVDPGESDWGFRTSAQTESAPADLVVPSISPATVLADPRLADTTPLILKIDIEGAEGELFSGDTAWMDRFPLVIIELHDWMLPFSGSSRSFIQAVGRYDFDFVHRGENIFLFNRRILAGV
jgi:FkbM family methyltransferase